jgi:predicted glycosyltransferase
LAENGSSLSEIAVEQAKYELRLLGVALRFRPDVVGAIGGLAASHVASAVGARSVVFTDTEHATVSNKLTFPFADRVCTPMCYRDSIGEKQDPYPGYHELAYLHPQRFSPDPSVLDEVDVEETEPFVVLRLITWDAAHDVGQGGFDDVTDVVERLEATGRRVLITAEGDLPAEVADRQVSVEPHRMHDLLYYADLFVGEGATTAAESAVLGTPAVYVNSLSMGYTDELDDEYGLLFGFHGENRHGRALEEAVDVLDRDVRWKRRRGRLLADSCDVTDVVVNRLTL